MIILLKNGVGPLKIESLRWDLGS